MKVRGIVFLFLLTFSRIAVGDSARQALLCGGEFGGQPVFLIARQGSVLLEDRTGKILFRERDVLGADISDGVAVAFLKQSSVVWLDGKMHRTEIKISALAPVLSLIVSPVHLSLLKNDLLLIPAENPVVLNLGSGNRRSFPEAIYFTGKSLVFEGIKNLWEGGDWLVFPGKSHGTLVEKTGMRELLSIPASKEMVADIWREGNAIRIRLRNGKGYRVFPISKKIVPLNKKMDLGEDVLRRHVRFGRADTDDIVAVRLKDTGPLSVLSAWKKGEMGADISIREPGGVSATYPFSFSIKTLNKFHFSLRRESGALILDFGEKDIVVTKQGGRFRFLTIRGHRPFAVAGGVVYGWNPDAKTNVFHRMTGEEISVK